MSLSVFIAAGMSVSFFLSYHVGNSASMSPVEFSKRPMSAVANYPFHTPIVVSVLDRLEPGRRFST